MYELTGMYFSPWTERARWALDHHGLPYRYSEYVTLLDEPLLRIKAGKPFSKVSVPLLIADGKRVHDSFLIAEFADAQSQQPPLVPAARREGIRKWVDDAEQALCAARILATRRISASTDALADRLPRNTPAVLRKPLVPMAYVATQYILRKYGLAQDSNDKLLTDLDAFLGQASRALAGREFVFDDFSFADIVIATALQAVTPVDNRYIYLGEPSRRCMREPEMALKYPALISWRDGIYGKYR